MWFWVNLAPHSSQTKGFSPVWILKVQHSDDNLGCISKLTLQYNFHSSLQRWLFQETKWEWLKGKYTGPWPRSPNSFLLEASGCCASPGDAAGPKPADTRLCSLSSPLNSTMQYLQSFLITVIDHKHLGDYGWPNTMWSKPLPTIPKTTWAVQKERFSKCWKKLVSKERASAFEFHN